MRTTPPPAATPQQALDRATEALNTMLNNDRDARRKAGYRATRTILGAAHDTLGATIADHIPEREPTDQDEAETLARAAKDILDAAEDLTANTPNPNDDAHSALSQALDHLAVALTHHSRARHAHHRTHLT